MHKSQVFIVRENGDVEHLADTSCPHGASLLIWNALAEKYNIDFRPFEGVINDLGKLAYSPDLPLFERISLICTLEGIWIRREHMVSVINALEDFACINLMERFRPEVQDIATVMRQAFVMPNCIGIAFNMVDTATPFWHVYEKLPDTETEDATLRKFNVFKDKGHIEIGGEFKLPPSTIVIQETIDER